MLATDALSPISVLLLSGGRGQRMGGQDKGLLQWRGKPLIQWVSEQVRTFSDDIIISCNRNQSLYAPFADRLVADESSDFQGPLAGIRAALAVARYSRLLVLPCDAPLVDAELINALRNTAPNGPAMIRQGQYWQPLFCVLPTILSADLEQAWQQGQRSVQQWLSRHQPSALTCTEDDVRLSNFNTPQMLQH